MIKVLHTFVTTNICCNKHNFVMTSFVTTSILLSWQTRVCCDKSMLVLSQQNYACCDKTCHDKQIFVATKDTFSHDKYVFVATKVCLSWQKLYLWQLPPMSPLYTSTTWTTSFNNHRLCIVLVSMCFCKQKNHISVWIQATHCQSCKNPCQYTDIHFYSKDTKIHALSIQLKKICEYDKALQKGKKYICFSTDASL